jgi:hypothetical protein
VERVVSIVHQKTLTVMMDMIDLMMTRGKGQVEPQSLDLVKVSIERKIL